MRKKLSVFIRMSGESFAVDKEDNNIIESEYRRMYACLYSAAFSRLHDRNIACDMVNDVFIEALKHRKWWCSQKRSVREKYLTAACERLCGAYLLRESKKFYVPYSDEKERASVDPDKIALAELRQSIDKCLELLEPEDRLLICGKYFCNYSTRQLSKIIGISRANVLQRLVRVRKKLGEILERFGITEA